LQAAHYGTPQGRVRFFLIAARHGLPLPDLPQPTHDFPLINALEIKLPNEDKIRPIRTANGTAPHPFVTIGDAISDLPRFDWYAFCKCTTIPLAYVASEQEKSQATP
jgi:DNA (cytosine-5)-methyltransferase 1